MKAAMAGTAQPADFQPVSLQIAIVMGDRVFCAAYFTGLRLNQSTLIDGTIYDTLDKRTNCNFLVGQAVPIDAFAPRTGLWRCLPVPR